MPQKYDAIIFDLGGVLYDIDAQLTKNAFAELGIRDFDRFYTLKAQTSLFDKLEKGQIGEAEFVAGINSISGAKLSHEQVMQAWNAILVGMPAESVTLLQNLKKQGYKLYLLSNTNIFHLNAINKEMEEKFGIPELVVLFDGAYYSYQIGMRKPDLEIYTHVMQNPGINPQRAVFIDDNEDNIKAARTAGLPAIHKTKDLSLEAIIEGWG